LLILARTWFAFGLPSKTGCDISGIKAVLTVGPLTLSRMAVIRIIDHYSHLHPWCHFKSWSSRPILCSTIYITPCQNFVLFLFLFYGLLAGHISSILTLMLIVPFVDGSS
jgi:hypothetical protein